MSFDKTDIANRALYKLGEERVSNVDTTDTKAARTIREMYDKVRDGEMGKYPWNFAIKRVAIAADATAPAWGYATRFTLPTDFLALLEVQNNPDYQIENGYILTDVSSTIKIRYIARITSEGSFDAQFVEVLACKLAVEGCEPITQSNTKKQLLLQEYALAVEDAYASDSIQDPPQRLVEDTWITAREDTVIEDDVDYDL